ncbi:MAG TPA: DUF4159 domain-containing protein [Rhizomicrobium sp.]|nr:DUF4159 domain-containing protein [Rhizomicrobium sp.]
MGLFAALNFGTPWILAALIGLPALWWLLKVTPPQPRRILFPPLRLLLGLKDKEQTPAHTPWWLMLLRVLAAALLILALADPLLGRVTRIAGGGPMVIVVDNGWTAARNWDQRQTLIADLLRAAGDRPVAIVPTANPGTVTLLDAGAAEKTARELRPMSWPGGRSAAAAEITRAHLTGRPEFFWLSDGIEDVQGRSLRQTLSGLGSLDIFAPDQSARGLLPPRRDATGFAVTAIRATTAAPASLRVVAIGSRGETLSDAALAFKAGEDRGSAHITVPLEVRNQTARLQIQGEESAGGVQLLDSGGIERRVGLVSAAATENEQPLLSDVYYLERALAPFAEVEKGTISGLIARHISVLFLADIGRIGGSDADQVEKFLKGGGVLIRFAGPRMAGGTDAFVPVSLRVGGRYLGSAMAWNQPQHLASFPLASPFNGLTIPNEVTVARQILAEPSAELSGRTWARLADGTPLVTARQDGAGWLVLFHITASPAWSSLPLSGLYVDMLKRLLALSAGTPAAALAKMSSLAPITMLDGFGRAQPPAPDILPIAASDFDHASVSARHPPGLYGAQGVASALNELDANATFAPLNMSGIQSYGAARTLALQPYLLALAALLLCLDALVALWLRGYFPRRVLGPAVAALALLLAPVPRAQADEAVNLKAALDTRLAYVITGLPDLDEMSRAGLTGLDQALKARTSYEPQDPMGVNLDRDDLSFFPLLYWPLDPREKNLSPAALSKLNDYMRLGGTILFDTRDLTLGAVRGPSSPGEQTLRRLTQGLDLPPLEPVPSDHVLTKAFYLVKDFPGRWTGGDVWVEKLPPAEKGRERVPARGGDGVSPVIIGGNDWAAAWAVDANGRPLTEPVPGGEMQREMALRFGINLVMYALTGNYKTDQVHAPALLERLGK